jgi:hypothetical protein
MQQAKPSFWFSRFHSSLPRSAPATACTTHTHTHMSGRFSSYGSTAISYRGALALTAKLLMAKGPGISPRL